MAFTSSDQKQKCRETRSRGISAVDVIRFMRKA